MLVLGQRVRARPQHLVLQELRAHQLVAPRRVRAELAVRVLKTLLQRLILQNHLRVDLRRLRKTVQPLILERPDY